MSYVIQSAVLTKYKYASILACIGICSTLQGFDVHEKDTLNSSNNPHRLCHCFCGLIVSKLFLLDLLLPCHNSNIGMYSNSNENNLLNILTAKD